MEEISNGNAQFDWQLRRGKFALRVLLINSFYAPDIRGGAEYSVKKLAEGLQSNGHTIRVLCTGDSDIEEVVDGIEIVRFRPHGAHKKKIFTMCHGGEDF